MLYNPEKAYSMLEEGYKSENFKRFSDYENYIRENKEAIQAIVYADYEVEISEEDIITYTAITTNKEKFIITVSEYSNLEYTITQ